MILITIYQQIFIGAFIIIFNSEIHIGLNQMPEIKQFGGF